MGARVLVVDDSSTIRKLVSAILARHAYDPVSAPDGQAGLEKLRESEFDLVLLDFVMPRMNGYQFCRELRNDAKLRHVPVVLMSAKGDKIRGQFVQQTGAVDAITKPFDARALVAVVESALQKAEEGRVRGPEASFPEEDTVADSGEGPISLRDDPGMRRVRAAKELAGTLSAIVAPKLVEIPDALRADTIEIGAAIARALGPEQLDTIALALRRLDLGDASKDVLSGDIAAIPLGEILQVLQLQRQTGVLVITNKKAEVTVSMREGLIDLAQGRGTQDEFRLGRYLVEEGLVTRDELDTLLKNRAGSKRLLGETLVNYGLVTDDDLRRALIRQSSELIYDVLRWPTGRFSFSRDAFRKEAENARLGLPVASIVMEGFRRVDEWRLIEETIQFDEVLLRDQVAVDALGAQKLTRQEQLVLDAIDGQSAVREIIARVNVGSFDACKILYQFLQSRLVRRRAA